MNYELNQGVPAIAVGLSAISLLVSFPSRSQKSLRHFDKLSDLVSRPVPNTRSRNSQRMPLQSLTQRELLIPSRSHKTIIPNKSDVSMCVYFLGNIDASLQILKSSAPQFLNSSNPQLLKSSVPQFLNS